MAAATAPESREQPVQWQSAANPPGGRVLMLGSENLSGLIPGLAQALRGILGMQLCCVDTSPHAAGLVHWQNALDGADAVLLQVSDVLNNTLSDRLHVSLTWLRHLRGRCPVLALGEALDMNVVEQLQAEGMGDFVLLPACKQEVVLRLQRLLSRSASPVAQRASAAATGAQSLAVQRRLIGGSEVFLAQLARVQRVADSDASVLIQGETGTGKELFAQSIHYTSARAGRALVAVNCGAIPGDLVEDELFGHVRGAYTTALQARPGLVREAEGGTLFLDDIDCLPMAAQAKLLRFLQEREYRSVGSNAVHRADVRVISASNRDLCGLAQAGLFRADLYYRLNVLSLRLPPLRERREDIAPMVMHFVRNSARRFGRPVTGITPRALLRLCAHAWPGNVRELQHVVDRAVLLSAHTLIDADDIELDAREPEALATPAATSPESRLSDASFREQKAQLVRDFERNYLQQLLASTQGNVAQAARTAGKDRRALFELIRKHHIDPERFRAAAG
jgi:DNA-binding NtrC family response regulator